MRRRQSTALWKIARHLLEAGSPRKETSRSAEEIEERFGLPKPLAEQYTRVASFFLQLRSVRDDVVHRGQGFGHIFETERGFCVNPTQKPFSSFSGWSKQHYYNENIVSVLPWIAHIVLQTIDACNNLMTAFASVIQLPPEIAPGFGVFVRGPHTESLAELLDIHSGSPPWWA
jgi:hypothetical protein